MWHKIKKKLAGDDGNVPFCEKCDRFWFDSFSSCVIVLVANEYNEIVLLRQGYMSDKYSTFVSGYISPGENAEEAAYREVEEEIGIALDSLEYAGSYWFDKKECLMHGFLGKTSKCDLILPSEVDSAEWTKAEDVANRIFPDTPGNAAFAIYKKYMKRLWEQDVTT